jgi:hypothetical protein
LWLTEKPDPLSIFAEIVGPQRVIDALRRLATPERSNGTPHGEPHE